MSNYIKYRNNLIKNGINILIVRDILMFDDYFRNRMFRNQINFIQEGGSSRKVKFEDEYYKFNKSVLDNNEVIYVLESKNDNIIDCVIISIVDKIVYISDIGNNKGCIKKNKIVNGGGAKLMNIILKLIKEKLKEKHNLEYLYLSDTAKKDIYDGQIIKLSNLLLFTKGYTYYEKFGFVPIKVTDDGIKYKRKQIKKYIEIKEKINKIKMKDINFNDLLRSFKKTDNKYEVLTTILNEKLKGKLVVEIVKYMSINKIYYPILNDFINYVLEEFNIILPKIWGMKL